MLTSLLYLFTFTSWGLGLLSALAALSMRCQSHSLKIKRKTLNLEADSVKILGQRALLGRLVGSRPSQRGGIPDELKSLMNRSPDHPEVSEITEKDEVFGVLFKAQSYPPTPDDSIEDS